MKACKTCCVVKPLTEYNKFRHSQDKLAYDCRVCASKKTAFYYNKSKEKDPLMNRKRNLWRQYKLSIEDFDRMLEKQKGVCAICNQKETTVRQGVIQPLSVDHCHDTGNIRGLLCNNCNRALGKFRDNLEILESACEYIKRYK